MKVRTLVALVALAVILLGVNASIYQKERLLSDGRTVLLELAPVDPRSLMQGDYMALRFAVGDELRASLPKKPIRSGWRKVDATDGWAILAIDERGIGQFAGVASAADSGADSNTVHMAFRVRSGTVKFATNAFFFQEGTAEIYEQARFGEFRISSSGEPLLVGLRDENLDLLGSQESLSP